MDLKGSDFSFGVKTENNVKQCSHAVISGKSVAPASPASSNAYSGGSEGPVPYQLGKAENERKGKLKFILALP
jgi:hypothetical protein